MSDVTRGFGLLEGFLAKKRAALANKHITTESRKGRILDVGCGSTPFFLMNTDFKEKHGLDYSTKNMKKEGVTIKNFDLTKKLPYKNNYFDVVTMLAVFEHIEQHDLPKLLAEIKRVLKPKGKFILTTPCTWTDKLLRTMAKMRLVSPHEIEEHKGAYNHGHIQDFLEKGGFAAKNMEFGYFEMYLNNWAVVRK